MKNTDPTFVTRQLEQHWNSSLEMIKARYKSTVSEPCSDIFVPSKSELTPLVTLLNNGFVRDRW